MAGLITDAVAEIKAMVIAATGLPDPPDGSVNMFTAVQGLTKSFIEQIRAASPRISLPCVVIDIGEFNQDTGVSVNSLGDAIGPTRIFYIDEWGPGSQDSTFEMAQAIKASVDSPTAFFETFQRREEGQILSGIDAPINAELLGDSGANVVCSAVVWRPGLRYAIY